jgi:hypothetical protein
VFEDHCNDALLLSAICRDHGVPLPRSLFGPEAGLLHSMVKSPRSTKGTRLFLRSGKQAEHTAHRLELGRRVIAQQSGKGAVGYKKSAVAAEQTETYRGIIGESAKQVVGATQCIFDSTPRNHCFLEIDHLLAQAGDLMDQLLLGAVLIAHGTM